MEKKKKLPTCCWSCLRLPLLPFLSRKNLTKLSLKWLASYLLGRVCVSPNTICTKEYGWLTSWRSVYKMVLDIFVSFKVGLKTVLKWKVGSCWLQIMFVCRNLWTCVCVVIQTCMYWVFMQILGQQINDFTLPDVNLIGEHADAAELGRMLQLILGCAVNCEQKQGISFWKHVCFKTVNENPAYCVIT